MTRGKRCLFLTMQDTGGWSIDADLAFEPMASLGWHCEWLPWKTQGVDWNLCDAVYIAAPWDYPQDPELFLQVLGEIDASSSVLVNDLSLVQWSIAKTYLRDIESRGAAIVPSLWFDSWHDELLLDGCFAAFGETIIAKPVVSTNATDTFLLTRPPAPEALAQLRKVFATRAFVVQPFIDNIRSEGEYSLFYFGKSFSHAIQKVPKRGDFRVQEEHGAAIIAVEPEKALREAGDFVMGLIDPSPVYCRCDFVRDAHGRFVVMELEMIEPSMYLRMHADAPRRFAEAFDNYVSASKTAGDR